MQFNSVKGNNNVAAGKAIADSSADIYDTSRRTAPDFTNIAKTSIEARSAERVAATRAETQVARQGIASKALLKGTKQQIASDKKVNDTLGGAKRFAGIVGGLGTLATASILHNQGAQEAALDKQDRDAFMTETRANFDRSNQLMSDYIETLRNNPTIITMPEASPSPSSSSDDTPSTSSTSNTDSNSSGVTTTVRKVGDTTSNYMSTLTAAGLGVVPAAALTGHLQYESGDFRHLEELEPNAYGTRGYGHLQWTDVPGGSSRRSDFLSYAKDNGLEPSSFEANSGFLLHEMQSDFNGSWTNGGSWEGLKSITDFDTASQYLQDNYIRPAAATANTSQRRANGRAILSSWRAQ